MHTRSLPMQGRPKKSIFPPLTTTAFADSLLSKGNLLLANVFPKWFVYMLIKKAPQQ